MLRIGLRIFTLLFCLVLLIGCEGEKGPAGPMGPPGPGSRIVYSGVVTSDATTAVGQVINVPDLDLSDFPLVAVYVSDPYGDWIQLNLVLYDSDIDSYTIFETAVLSDGQIVLFSLSVDQEYRIVIVY